jgi:TPR repeat protein
MSPEENYTKGVYYTKSDKYDLAYKFFSEAAGCGYAPAEVSLGLCCLHGKGTPRDVNRAFKLFKSAADKGFESAYMYVAYCYYYGEGVAKNEDTALVWYKKSEQGK